MIEHISLRCRNSRSSRKFYEKALAPLGYRVDREYGDSYGFIEGGRHDFWVTKGKVGTPIHLAFHADATSAVDRFYRAAIAAGGKNNGPPGMREEYGYAAFVLDPDGHNVEAVIWNEDLERAKSRGSVRPKRRRARRSRG
jgi:catechol 2,3-dioxygenase-like lactoylglutathione lyase family enzyme